MYANGLGEVNPEALAGAMRANAGGLGYCRQYSSEPMMLAVTWSCPSYNTKRGEAW